jgi:hypothetical protein
VASILEHNLDATIQYWMELVEDDQELTWIPLSFEDAPVIFPISSLT